MMMKYKYFDRQEVIDLAGKILSETGEKATKLDIDSLAEQVLEYFEKENKEIERLERDRDELRKRLQRERNNHNELWEKFSEMEKEFEILKRIFAKEVSEHTRLKKYTDTLEQNIGY